jgi:hypothetical protein
VSAAAAHSGATFVNQNASKLESWFFPHAAYFATASHTSPFIAIEFVKEKTADGA